MGALGLPSDSRGKFLLESDHVVPFGFRIGKLPTLSHLSNSGSYPNVNYL